MVIEFKRGVYEQALNELARFLDADYRRMRRNRARHRVIPSFEEVG